MRKSLFTTALVALTIVCRAQGYDGSLNSVLDVAAKYKAARPVEKLYLQTAKTNYAPGDTLWFKAYLFDASVLRASKQSSIVYIDISDDSNTLLIHRMVEIKYGTGWGCIALPRRDFTDGAYTLRAYTQWMRNFDESGIYKQQFFVNDVKRDTWLVDMSTQQQDEALRLNLKFTDFNKRPIAGQKLFFGIKQSDDILFNNRPETTSADGTLEVSFKVKDAAKPVYAWYHKGRFDDLGEPVIKLPVIVNRPEKTDLQFMPEGGYLVAGIPTVVGFKAVGEDGKGVSLSGNIVNANTGIVVAQFTTNAKGMGNFQFTPQPGVNYKAVAELPNGVKKDYLIPVTKPAGTVLSVVNLPQADSITIKISASAGLNGRYFLLGQSRGMICYAAKTALNAPTQIFKIPKNAFAGGVVRFSLLNEQLKTLNERVIYIEGKDILIIDIKPDKNTYTPQDSIALQIAVKDSFGKPVQGTFSMSVINDIGLTTARPSGNIFTHLLLEADLKGDVEDPAYYLEANHQKELDDLLLTQGWTGFNWTDILQPQKQPAFKPETSYNLVGKVISLFGQPSKKATVNLLSFYPFYSETINVDSLGRFKFNNLPQTDSVIFLRARNKNDKPTTYEIQLDTPARAVFKYNTPQLPWFINAGKLTLAVADTLLKKADNLQNPFKTDGKVLRDVNINAKKIIPGSHNLNGPGNADQTIDQHDIFKGGNKITLLELLKKLVHGIRIYGMEPRLNYYVLSERIGGFIFDGINPSKLHINIYDLLTTYTSDDILGIEVMSMKYTSQYELKYLERPALFPVPFIEITTRGGIGPFKRADLAGVRYHPTPKVSEKEFYRPVYKIKNSTAAAYDDRTTIHWEPNIVTDKDGKATVSFYAAGQPATYTITTEGSDMNGSVGSTVRTVKVSMQN